MQLGPVDGVSVYRSRREMLKAKLGPGTAAIIAAQPTAVRNSTVTHLYRPNSHLYYLTGFSEPDCVLVIVPDSPTPVCLFVREKDPKRELWDGFHFGVEGAEKYFGIDKAFPILALEKELPALLKSADRVYNCQGIDSEFDQSLVAALEATRSLRGRTWTGMPSIHDLNVVLGEMRLFKEPIEIEKMKKAAEITCLAHRAVLKTLRPGVNESEITALLEYEFRRNGAQRPGYNTIVAGGANATTLHYIFNDEECKAGDLLLIDAAAEFHSYTADVTRTYAVSGKFSPAQRRMYEIVLRAQKASLAHVKPGVTMQAVHEKAVEVLVGGMVELGLLQGRVNELIEKKAFTKYYPHHTSHWLGMDVHDVGLYHINGEHRKLEPGQVFTVEPGLYVAKDDTDAPAEMRGIGIRIEDDVLVTPSGHENLTAAAPKEIEALEH